MIYSSMELSEAISFCMKKHRARGLYSPTKVATVSREYAMDLAKLCPGSEIEVKAVIKDGLVDITTKVS